MRRFFLKAATVVLALLLAGCGAPVRETGTNFDSAKLKSITLGKTTREELLALLGKPYRDSAATYRKDYEGKPIEVPLVVHSLIFYFSSNSSAYPTDAPKTWGHRHVVVDLVDNVVAGYRMDSTFQNDSTEFDLSKFNALKKGVTTVADVEAMFGKPSGMSVHPLAGQKNGRVYFYRHSRLNLATNSDEEKWMSVSFGDDQRALDFNVKQKEQARPVTYQPAPIVIPVYIPARR